MVSKAPPLARKRGKKYAEKFLTIEPRKSYLLPEAVELLTKVSTCSFDATAEAHLRMNADTKQADQLVRTTVNLPHGTGKVIRIAAFVPDDRVLEAKEAGALRAGNAELITSVQEGTIDFDVAIATPSMMKGLGKIAKVLGPKGLMPNPKTGTVTEDIVHTISLLKKGRIECKMDSSGIIHVPFGKLSFGPQKLRENLESILGALEEARPSGIKGVYILSLSIAPTMGPSVKVKYPGGAPTCDPEEKH